MIWITLLFCILSYFLYKYYKQFQHWKIRGVVHNVPVPIFGDFYKAVLKKMSFYESAIDIYKQHPGKRFTGIFQFNIPTLLIKDIEIAKKVCVKDFDHFMDHRVDKNIPMDELFAKNLVLLKGEEWKEMRSLLSPAFTSSKMKAMFHLISECAEQFTNFFLEKNEELIELEMKDLFTKFTNDVIATCAFGIECNSLKDNENTFYKMGQEAISFRSSRIASALIFNISPKLFKLLGLRLFDKNITDFFKNIMRETVAYREENGVIRPDMIHLLMEARKGRLNHEITDEKEEKSFAVIEESHLGKQRVAPKKPITDVDMAAQAFIFFLAGFDTSSSLMSFLSTELAINVDVQEKLYEEISKVMNASKGKPNYEEISGMKYLDMVVSESLRKWPIAPFTDRQCIKEYKIEPENKGEEPYIIKVDDIVAIPIVGFQRDEKYFPNPEKFDPERFSDENKHNIEAFSYMPFGVGPRACIGSRFALLEIKILFVYLLHKFELKVIEKTVVPLKLSPKTFKMQPENGFWLGFKRRP